MEASNFKKCFKFILQFEGGFVNNPADPGGPTNLGVTQGTLSMFLGRQATIAEVKALTPEKVNPIYRLKFWDRVNGDELPVGVDLAVFDFGVHSGPSRCVISLQRSLHLGDDGKPGPVTMAAAKKADAENTVNAICDERMGILASAEGLPKVWTGPHEPRDEVPGGRSIDDLAARLHAKVARNYSGKLSCFLRGRSACLVRSIAKARTTRARVSCGSITSSM